MENTQYLTFIPLLLYGISLADIMSKWKRLFDPKEFYLPYILLTIILSEVGVYNVFIYINLVDQLPGQNYFTYLTYLIPPFLFLLASHAFTPDPGSDTKEYFLKRMRVIFILIALFVASHFLYEFSESMSYLFSRIVMMTVVISIAITRKIWLIYLLSVLWLLSFIMRGALILNS